MFIWAVCNVGGKGESNALVQIPLSRVVEVYHIPLHREDDGIREAWVYYEGRRGVRCAITTHEFTCRAVSEAEIEQLRWRDFSGSEIGMKEENEIYIAQDEAENLFKIEEHLNFLRNARK